MSVAREAQLLETQEQPELRRPAREGGGDRRAGPFLVRRLSAQQHRVERRGELGGPHSAHRQLLAHGPLVAAAGELVEA